MPPPSLSLDAFPTPPAPAKRPTAVARKTPAPAMPRLDAAPRRARQPRGVIVATLAFHVLLVIAALNFSTIRAKVNENAPVFLAVVAAPAPTPAPQPLPPPPRSVPHPPVLDIPLIAPEPSPSPSPMLAQALPAAPPEPRAQPSEAPPAPQAVAAPAPAAKTIPASAVQYLVQPAPVYSRTSSRLKESGRVVVRVYIDEGGMPRDVQVATSSGFARLDDSALAAVRGARFKPYVENGAAVAGWAFIPIEFELPK